MRQQTRNNEIAVASCSIKSQALRLELGPPAGKIMNRLFFGVLAVFLGASVPAAAQDWPRRPITIVLPLAAGGGSDGLVRVVTPRLGEILGQQVIIENVGGAGGMIGAARVAKATPDGYEDRKSV